MRCISIIRRKRVYISINGQIVSAPRYPVADRNWPLTPTQ